MRITFPRRSFSCLISSPSQKQLLAALVIILSWGAISSQASTIVVPNGGDLQAAINAANFGDTIILAAGGGHRTLNVGSESADFVPFFYNYGVTTIILRNRLRNDGYDVQADAVRRAVDVRDQAERHEWRRL